MHDQNVRLGVYERMAKAAKNQYQREWYKSHPGKASEYQRRYWLRQAQKLMEAEREESHEE